MGPGLKHHLGAIDHGAKIYGAELGVRIYGAKLGARIYGVKQCKLGASNDVAELKVQILKCYLLKHICEIFSKKS